MTVRADLEALCAQPIADLGAGRTAERWLTMFDWALGGSVSVARLAEAHADAVAILREGGRDPVKGAIYGVWASVDPRYELRLDGSGTLSGTKSLCSGLGIVDRALVAVVGERGEQLLVDVEASGPTVISDVTGWATPAMFDTATGTVGYTQHPVEIVVGDDAWYLERPGFWNGAIGPAACWAGAAAGLGAYADAKAVTDQHQLVARGVLRAEAALCQTLLRDAGRDIDDHPTDQVAARRRAYVVRHLVERSATRSVDAFSRAFGPRPFVSDGHLAQRVSDLMLYVRQQHDSMYGADADPWGFDSRFYERRKYALTLAALPRERYVRAVEPGCSNGAFTELLAPRCDELIAFDFVEDAVERARRRLTASPHVTLACAEFPMWWPEGTGDLVVWSEVAYYLTERGCDAAEVGLADWLRPGGHLVAVHYTGRTDYPLSGDEAHRWIDGIPFLQTLFAAVDEQFVMRVWGRE